MKSYLFKKMKNKFTRSLLLTVFTIMFCVSVFIAGGQQAAALTPAVFNAPQDRTNMSQSWSNDYYFDYTTLLRNSDVGSDTKLVTTQTFGSKYTVRFTLSVDKNAWDGNAKAMFRFALNAADDNNTDSGDQIYVWEHNIGADNTLTVAPTEYGGTSVLWQQTYRDGSSFGPFPEGNGFYEFMLDVDGDTLDLYIERKIDLPFTQPRYTVTTSTDFEGHLAFMSVNSEYDFRVGGVTVDYTDAQGNPAQFKGQFNVDGSISDDFNNADCLWHTNLLTYNTQSEEAYYVSANNQIVSDFTLGGLWGVLEYEVSEIENHNLWSNQNAGIRFVAGITDDNPQGYNLATLCNNYLNVAASQWDFSLNDNIQGGLRSPSTSFKIKLALYESSYQVYISALLGGEYTDYFHVYEDNEELLGDIPYTWLSEDAADDIANGKIAVRASHDTTLDEDGNVKENPVSFSVKALTIEEYVNILFKVDGEDLVTKTAVIGELFTDAPEIPQKEGHTAEWDVDFATTIINAATTVNAVYTIETFDVDFVADGETIKTLTVNYGEGVASGDIPAIPEKTGYTKTVPVWDKTGGELDNIKENITVNAVYTLNTYTVTPPAEENFTFTSTDSATVDHGDSYAFTITPAAAYDKATVTVKVDGTALAPVSGVYTIDNITDDVTITVDTLNINTYTVTFKADGVTVKTVTVNHGSGVVSGDIPTVPAKEGFTGVWKDVSLTSITADTVIDAEYSAITEQPKEGGNGCGCGSVVTESGILFGILLLGIAVVMFTVRAKRKS